MHLQERNRETDDTVTPQPTTEHLIHRTLTQECFDDEYKRAEYRKLPEKPEDHLSRENAVDVVDADVHCQIPVIGDELDYGDPGFGYNRDIIRDPCALHRVR